MSDLIRRFYGEATVIAGTATAGIPHAAWVAEELGLPMIYVRSKPKDHGQGRQIEGVLVPDAKVVVIDDLLSTGGSVLNAVKAVQKEGAEVLGVVADFSYQLPALDENCGRQPDLPHGHQLHDPDRSRRTQSHGDLRPKGFPARLAQGPG